MFNLFEVLVTLHKYGLPLKTMCTSLLKNIISILVEEVYNILIIMLCKLFVLLSVRHCKVPLFVYFCDSRTDPASDDEYELFQLFERYYQTAQEISFPLPQGIITTIYREFVPFHNRPRYPGHQCMNLKLGEFANCIYSNGRVLPCHLHKTALNALSMFHRIHFLLHCSWIQESEHKVRT